MSVPPSSSLRPLSLLWLGGVGLRLAILAVPPVLALIISDLGLSGTEVGILNAIPVFLFAVVSIPGSLLIARVGSVPALVIGLLIAAVGSALRGFAFDATTLYAATVLMAAGIAVTQPAMLERVPREHRQNLVAIQDLALLVAQNAAIAVAIVRDPEARAVRADGRAHFFGMLAAEAGVDIAAVGLGTELDHLGPRGAQRR